MLVASVMGNSCLSEVAKTAILKTELPAPIQLSSQLVTAFAEGRYRGSDLVPRPSPDIGPASENASC
jgi:hypothetical protein